MSGVVVEQPAYSIRYPYAFTHMSGSPYGRDVVLAGRAGLAVVDVAAPQTVQTVALDSAWPVSAVAWSASATHSGWVATAAGPTLAVHDLARAGGGPMRAARAHARAITDVAWAPLTPAWLGTASLDATVQLWDVRRATRPVWRFTRWEAADRLAFSAAQAHVLATAHRGSVAVWDVRFGSAPALTLDDVHEDVAAVAWHPARCGELLTAARDGAVKQWHVSGARPALAHTLALTHGVLGAHYAPDGDALLLRVDTPASAALVLRDTGAGLCVERRLAGHAAADLGAAWRGAGEVVTWGSDRVLRRWDWSYEKEALHAATSKTFETDNQPVSVEPYEADKSFAASFARPEQLLRHAARRPQTMRRPVVPAGGSASDASDAIGGLAGQLCDSDSSQADLAGPLDGSSSVDGRVAFPRLCGAVFSGGRLVVFFAALFGGGRAAGLGGGRADRSRADTARQLRAQSKPRTLRKLEHYRDMVLFCAQNRDAVLPFGSAPPDSDDARDEEVPRYYFRQQPSPAAAQESHAFFHPARPTAGIGNIVLLRRERADCAADRSLARQFAVAGAAPAVCRHNARVAVLNSRRALAHVWALLACLTQHAAPASTRPVRRWLRAVFAHYQRRGDVQALALLACVLNRRATEPVYEPSVEPPALPKRAKAFVPPHTAPPQLLAPLDANDVHELELLMAPPPPKPPVEPPSPPPSPPPPRAGSADAARSPADPAETIWRRLRSNMLGRTATTAVLGVPPPAAPPAPRRRTPARAPPPGEAQLWAALQNSSASQSTQGVAAQAVAKEQSYERIKSDFRRLHTRMVVRAADAPPAPKPPPALDQWKLAYANILFMWQMDARAIEVLKCLADPQLRALYSRMHSQPSVPRHDNLPRSGNPVVALREPFGGPWLSCTWCHEYVHGRALICHACGHGGHQEHILRWFRSVRRQLVHNGLAPAHHASEPPVAELHVPTSPVLAADDYSSSNERVQTLANPPPDALGCSYTSGLQLFATSPDSASPASPTSPAAYAFAEPAWLSSDGESDGCLRASQCTVIRQELCGTQRGGRNVQDEAFAQQRTVPTCPSGCGCNCLYKSHTIS
ncbi:hypothetical protein COEREDRAFT_88895 [Coemansia reversa NRRL 1564]|uniref:Uncharacterized protein n=1 Tax=Coemansia reversa (strain ATCC 12441 / NRRL 1564) TaxID=763665 RepID=A0A2G5B5E4_COERN|nr:hypothetical protein COEREDRAFT_88895 [Coemansia reversa NRRL 1564]|eukprot:PIA14226.1 hypothetical protein COEREDRAFT_88895 [Coemansia reversa NRRL 1564]